MSAPTPFLPLLARVMAGPLIWIVHFTLVYSTIAVMCARFGGVSDLADNLQVPAHSLLQAALGFLTLVALVVIAWQVHPLVLQPRSAPNPATRFMVWTTLALALLSVVALAANTLVALSFSDCRG